MNKIEKKTQVRKLYDNIFNSSHGKEILEDLENHINEFPYNGDINALLISQGKRELLTFIREQTERGKSLNNKVK